MIACRRCLQPFAPAVGTYVGTQIFTGLVLALHNCPNTDAHGEICGSTAALVLWNGEPDEESEALAAE